MNRRKILYICIILTIVMIGIVTLIKRNHDSFTDRLIDRVLTSYYMTDFSMDYNKFNELLVQLEKHDKESYLQTFDYIREEARNTLDLYDENDEFIYIVYEEDIYNQSMDQKAAKKIISLYNDVQGIFEYEEIEHFFEVPIAPKISFADRYGGKKVQLTIDNSEAHAYEVYVNSNLLTDLKNDQALIDIENKDVIVKVRSVSLYGIYSEFVVKEFKYK